LQWPIAACSAVQGELGAGAGAAAGSGFAAATGILQ
jgi:hypothetical protein